jgi:hypothetical protein
MKVISVPGRLRLAAWLLLMAVPIAALETIIATRAPWWRLPYSTMENAALAAAAVFLPLSILVQKGKKWALWSAVGILTTWVALSGWFAVRTHHPALGFFTLFLVLFFGMVANWIRQELERSYFDPRISWYHGLPKPVPGLSCEAAERRFRVARLDEQGTFLYLVEGSTLEPVSPRDRLGLVFAFRDRELRCQGFPIRELRGRQGIGVQFRDLAPDMRKELGDFVELLKGEGYVE